MPLDALNGRQSATLADCLTSIGVVPIPMCELENHKAEQVRRNPPHVLFTAKPYISVGLLTYLGVVVWGASNSEVALLIATLLGWVAGVLTTGFTAALLALLSNIFEIRLRGHAHWVETYAARGRRLNPAIPPAIREVAEYVRERLPHSYVIQGDLIQRNEVLDPYLVIQLPNSGERVCLGIWDGDQVIRVAKIVRD